MNTPAGQSKPTPVETVLVSFDSDLLLLGRIAGGEDLPRSWSAPLGPDRWSLVI
jgi:hypothetical protein